MSEIKNKIKASSFTQEKKFFFELTSLAAALLSLMVILNLISLPQSIRNRAQTQSPSTSLRSQETDTFNRYLEDRQLAVRARSRPEENILPKPSLPRDATSSARIRKKAMVVIFNPILENQGGVKLVDYMNWYDPREIARSIVRQVLDASSGQVFYDISEIHEVDDIPVKGDGFSYTDETYLACAQTGGTSCHQPDIADYFQILDRFQACQKRSSGEIHELWMWGGPWFGFWESNLAGPNNFWYNSPPLLGTGCQEQLPIMGYNYERIDGLLHPHGHRTESVFAHFFNGWQQNRITNDWERFALVNVQSPDFNVSGCGNTHFPPNAQSDYDYANPLGNESVCGDFSDYPNLNQDLLRTGTVSCSDWGCTQNGYLKWWFSHLPKAEGTNNNPQIGAMLNNWWEYILDFRNAVRKTPGSCTTTPSVGQIAPDDDSELPSSQTAVSLTGGPAEFNTCHQVRRRSIWVRDLTDQEDFYELCAFTPSADEASFSCNFSGLDSGHEYEWFSRIENIAYIEDSGIRSFSVASCTFEPSIGLISPGSETAFPSSQTAVSLTAGPATFNTCEDVRRRSIWVRNASSQESFYELCYFLPTSDETSFSCIFSGLTSGSTYEWFAKVENSDYSTDSETWNFSIGSP